VAMTLHAFAGSEKTFKQMRDLGKYGTTECLLKVFRCPELD